MLNHFGPKNKKNQPTVFYQQIPSNLPIHLENDRAKYTASDGSQIDIPCDLVICATGYENTIDFFPTQIPVLYKRIVPLYDSSIGFIGFSASFNWARVSDAQARWWIQHIMGAIQIPSISDQQKEIQIDFDRCSIKSVHYQDLSYEVYSYLKDLDQSIND